MTRRADAKRNLAKVAKVALKNPLATQREIAKEAGVWLGTVNFHKKKLEQNWTKDDRIVGILDSDLNIVTLAQDAIIEKLTDPEQRKKTWMGEISRVAAESSRRYAIFGGKVTDEFGWLKEVWQLSLDDLLAIVSND